ncbi:hypothetical protein H8R18_05335 [Nanchangia anserum]|uniref:CT398-like coiled coil hairpin domain-containing protein n=1 Tax=Nanchangia anserum TaxID=2692125 RepID=A0A8I0G890_9ACTO|nr:hypothetical protein [Nanchangia anserum]MBD3688964.1 hypothetical protein [Nanchangia anserum]QOX81222.1 hypothetical protein H8R18_05335 [Nanchangia anserum]
MKAPVDDQRVLLKVQQIDREITKVRHQRAQAQGEAQLAELAARAKEITRERVQAATAASDCQREVTRVETDLSQVRRRLDVQRGRLDSSETSSRELAGLEDEIAHITRRIDELEEQQLALLEQQESHEARANELASTLEELRTRAQSLRDDAGVEVERCDSELRHLEANRATTLEGVDADLVALYDSVRELTGGIGAVAVYGQRVEGMPIALSPAEAEQLRAAAPDDVIQSEEYDVILVRMPTE